MLKKYYPFIITSAILSIGIVIQPALAADDSTDTSQRLSELRQNIKTKETAYDDLQEKIDVYEENLKSKQQEKLTLNSQLEVLDQDIALNETELEQTQVEIDTLTLQIDELEIQINDTQSDIDQTKDDVSTLLVDLYYHQEQTYLEVMLTHSTLSEFSEQIQYSEDVNEEFTKTVKELRDLKKQYQQDQTDLDTKKKENENKQAELSIRQSSLDSEKSYKESLLTEVENDEDKFQQLVSDLQKEQNDINAELTQLEKTARQTYNQTNPGSTTDTVFDNNSKFDPIWPVTGIITTYFHDPNYVYGRYFPHDAIDIDSTQGFPIKAADDGVVGIVRYDGSTSYSFVSITHAGNFSTVYGHVSQVYVEAGEVVKKGQVIAAIGGLPGTVGAGSYTTGDHLHFSVRYNGIAVDPLLYLP